jgi:hypothetical protein
MVHLPAELRRASEEWARDDGERMAIYVLAHRRRARAAAAGAAVCVAAGCLLVALLLRSPWLALMAIALGVTVYFMALWSAERSLRIRLDASHAVLSACVERFMADPDNAAKAAMLKRADAQVSLRR